MTDDQPRNFKPLIYGLVVLAILGGAWLSRPAYRQWKKQRYLGRAESFLQQADYKNAALSARQVLALDPAHLRATAIMCEVLARVRSPEVVTWRQLLADLEPDNPTNRIALAEAALSFGDVPRAEQALVRVPPASRDSVEFHQVAGFVLASQRKLSEAEAHFSAALKLAPSNTLLRLNHAVILMQARDSNVVASAIRTLESSAEDPATRRIALQNLAQAYLQKQEFDKSLATAKALATGTNAGFGDQMLLLSVAHQAGSPELPELLKVTKQQAAAGPEQIQALAGWLIGTKQTGEALHWLTNLPAATQSGPRVAVCVADAYLASRDWAALQRLTEKSSWAEMEFVRLSMLARACREQGQNVSADAAWLGAVRAAGSNPRILTMLARQAGSWGWTHEEEELLWVLVERHPGERWAAGTLSATLVKNGNTRGLNRLAALLYGQNSANLAAKNDLAATSLLLNLQLTRAHELARELFTQYPSNAAFASTYAYSLHVQGKHNEALKAFASVKPEALAQSGVALYYGLVLGTNSPVEARKYLEIAAGAGLLPEEKALLGQARKGL